MFILISLSTSGQLSALFFFFSLKSPLLRFSLLFSSSGCWLFSAQSRAFIPEHLSPSIWGFPSPLSLVGPQSYSMDLMTSSSSVNSPIPLISLFFLGWWESLFLVVFFTYLTNFISSNVRVTKTLYAWAGILNYWATEWDVLISCGCFVRRNSKYPEA